MREELVKGAAILESHDTLRTQLHTIMYASYFSELVERLFAEQFHFKNAGELFAGNGRESYGLGGLRGP